MTSSRARLRLEVIVRTCALAAAAIASVAVGNPARSSAALLLLVAVSVLATALRSRGWLGYAVLLAEAVATCVIALIAPGQPLALLPYLAAPLVLATLRARYVGALAVVASSALTLVLVSSIQAEDRFPAADVVMWIAVASGVALLAWAVMYLRRRMAAPTTDYRTANRLLTALREVARALPDGLDTVNLAESALERLHSAVPGASASAVYLAGEDGRFRLVAVLPEECPARSWNPTPERGVWAQAWETGMAVQRTGSFTDPGAGSAAVLPLRVGARRVGAIAVEWPGPPCDPTTLRAAQDVADDAALRIDTASLFADIRELATAEERRRLSREIHDGVAQEVAALGFLVDGARSTTADPATAADLERIRDELTRLVTELRLSIFDLRSDVGTGMRLGEALAEYVRGVGSQVGWTVHLVLEEAPSRLPRAQEAELLRIAQEAVTNVRKHAAARNVWVSLRVSSPGAYLRIADDGVGAPVDVDGHFGLTVMRERASRIGAALSWRPRPGGGTVVECVLGRGTAPPDGDLAALARSN